MGGVGNVICRLRTNCIRKLDSSTKIRKFSHYVVICSTMVEEKLHHSDPIDLI